VRLTILRLTEVLATSLGFIVAFTLILSQVPIATALGLVGFGGYVILNGWTPALSMVATITRDSTLTYTLIVLPLFVLMGNLVAGAGISGDLFRAAQAIMGRRRGSLAMATVTACGGFGAICGSSVATAATMAKVAIPSMRRLGYSKSLSAAAVAAGGTLGVLIPPSIIMVVYGVATQTHIGKLFAAGIVPGIVAVVGYLLAVKYTVWRYPSSAPVADDGDRVDGWQLLRSLWPVVVIFAVVMGGIYGGLFTAVEASGIGAVTALAFAISRHNLRWRDVYAIFVDTAQTSAMMFAIILGAALFGEFVNMTGVHESLLRLVEGSGLPPFGIVLVMIVIYLVLGCVLETLSMILLTVPIFFPIITMLGYDPVWFGVLIVVVVEIGLITPPIGVNLFVIRSVVKDITMAEVVRGVLPFIVADIARVLLIAALPALSLWLPELLFKSTPG
jgi:tripartite ATP-independent transporter DctM subunit